MTAPKVWKSGEIVSLTSLRGVAALGVALAHFMGIAVLHRQYLWVDFFFILSGFILTHAYSRLFSGHLTGHAVKVFFKARFFRIFPLHYAMLLALILLEFMKLAMHRPAFTAWNSLPMLAANIVLLQNWLPGSGYSWNMPAWSISVELAAYLLFPFLLVFAFRSRSITITLLLASIVCLLWRWRVLGGAMESPDIFRCVCEFFIGMALYKAGPLVKVPGQAAVLQIALFAGLAMVFLVPVPDFWALPLFAVLVGTLGTDQGGVADLLKVRPLRFLGLISYSIYLVHFVVYQFFFLIDHRMLHDVMESGDVQTKWMFAAFLMPFVVMAATVTYFFIEVPCREWGARRFVRLKKAAA